MPPLSDDAVVQIHNFIAHVLDLFEARYGDQIHRYYDDRSAHNMIPPDTPPNIDDPPFGTLRSPTTTPPASED